jgi:hypothetical protein
MRFSTTVEERRREIWWKSGPLGPRKDGTNLRALALVAKCLHHLWDGFKNTRLGAVGLELFCELKT